MLFWKRKATKEEEIKLPGPKNIPDLAARYMVVKMNKDSDWVWKLKGVIQPTGKKTAFYCRVFDETRTREANVNVENWTSLDEHPELILWEGYIDKETNDARLEKFVKLTE